MESFIILLRGINVSGKNIVKMADLRTQLTACDFQNVQTYIQSGNIVLESAVDQGETEKQIKEILLKMTGNEIPVFALTAKELNKVMAQQPFDVPEDEFRHLHVVFNRANYPEETASKLEAIARDDEKISLKDGAIFIHSPKGIGTSKLDNNRIERLLQSDCTARNWRTCLKLQSMLGD